MVSSEFANCQTPSHMVHKTIPRYGQTEDRQTDRQTLFFKGNGPYLTLVISSYPDDLVKAPTPNLANVRATV